MLKRTLVNYTEVTDELDNSEPTTSKKSKPTEDLVNTEMSADTEELEDGNGFDESFLHTYVVTDENYKKAINEYDLIDDLHRVFPHLSKLKEKFVEIIGKLNELKECYDADVQDPLRIIRLKKKIHGMKYDLTCDDYDAVGDYLAKIP